LEENSREYLEIKKKEFIGKKVRGPWHPCPVDGGYINAVIGIINEN
jgi:hypothetical protein